MNIDEKDIELWIDSLTLEERESIYKYTLDGQENFYEKINNHLRGIEKNEDMEVHIKNIDSALSKFKLGYDILVYRAQGDLSYNELSYEGEKITLDDILTTYRYVKKFITYKNYISTSVTRECAESHLKNYLYLKQPNNFYLFIEAILKSGSSCGYIKSLSKYQAEEEMLIMRNKQFSISEVGIYNEKTLFLKGEFAELEGII